VSVDTGRVTIEAEFSTRGSAPFEAVAEVARSKSEVVAAVHVLSGTDIWIAELDEAERAACAGEGGYLDEDAAFDVLMSTAASVIDDFERKLQAAGCSGTGRLRSAPEGRRVRQRSSPPDAGSNESPERNSQSVGGAREAQERVSRSKFGIRFRRGSRWLPRILRIYAARLWDRSSLRDAGCPA
jgi:hypothetical protein